MKNLKYAIVLSLFFANCESNNELAGKLQLKSLLGYPFISGSFRNGRSGMEGIEFTLNKQDSTRLNYCFSITNWRDSFTDLKGTLRLDSTTLDKDTFFIKGVNDSLIAAYKFYDNDKKYPIWVGISKKKVYELAAIYENTPESLKVISPRLWPKK